MDKQLDRIENKLDTIQEDMTVTKIDMALVKVDLNEHKVRSDRLEEDNKIRAAELEMKMEKHRKEMEPVVSHVNTIQTAIKICKLIAQVVGFLAIVLGICKTLGLI